MQNTVDQNATAEDTVEGNSAKSHEMTKHDSNTLLDYLLFLPFIITFFFLLFVFDVLQRVALLFGNNAQRKCIDLLNLCICYSLKLLAVKIQIEGSENIPKSEPVIIVANHQSLFDIPIIHTVFSVNRPGFIAKKELGKWLPSVSINLRQPQNALIDRQTPKDAIKSIRAMAKRAKESRSSIVIFPEGTRARDGKVKKFKPVGLATLVKNLPEYRIVPVSVCGSWLLAKNKFGPIPTCLKVIVTVHEEVIPVDYSNNDELADAVEEQIKSAIYV
jgi:1-acyl-sn-glycerol-3-phosphate acyltransferase